MMAVSFLIVSWFWMSLVCIALIFGIYFQMKRGD
jgi:type II secretory pathway component PulF